MPATRHHTTQQRPSPLFTLPLELREKIYHYVFQTHRFLYAAFPPQPPPKDPHTIPLITPATHLRDLHLRYRLPDTLGRAHSSFSDYACTQTWLLASKSLMHEALRVFVRNAEWTYPGHGLWSTRPSKRHWTTRLPVNATRVTRMQLYVENLAYWEDPAHVLGWDSHGDVARIAATLRASGVAIEKLGFVGHSYALRPAQSGVSCGGQVGNMFRNLRAVFAGLPKEIECFELGVTERPGEMYWVLFDWVEGEGVRLLVHERRRRVRRPDPPPEQDLARLLPEGWVKEREKCGDKGCDGCWPSETAEWVSFEL